MMNSLKYILTSTAIAFFLLPTFLQESAVAMDGDTEESSPTKPTKKPQKSGIKESSWEENFLTAEAAYWSGNSQKAFENFLIALMKSPDASKVKLGIPIEEGILQRNLSFEVMKIIRFPV